MRAFVIASLTLLLQGTEAAGGGDIYPADLWQHSTKLDKSNFDGTIQTAIDSGKTLFVRWIASNG